MKLKFIIPVLLCGLLACKKKDRDYFEVSGTLTNSKAKMIYLEEIPVATMQSIIVDSSQLRNGRYTLKTTMREATIYNLRLDQNAYPLASVLNDEPTVTVNAT